MKKLFALILAVCLLCGCQLATQEKNETEANDKLVGVFITFEYLGGEFDIERWLQENPGAAEAEDVILNFSESMEYSERIPVLLQENEWLVPGYEGMSMGRYWNGEYWTGFSTEGLCELKSYQEGGEDRDSIEEKATIYVPLDAVVMLHANPVYQTPEGEYYALPAMGLQGEVSSGGMSQSVQEEKTWTENGEEYTYSAKYTVAVKGVDLASRVVLVRMSADHTELSREEFVPGQLPDAIDPEGAAYLILEQLGAGEITRQLYQPGDRFITVYYQSEQSWCLPEMMEILWSE